MTSGASQARAADKSETGSRSSLEVATAAPPGPGREQRDRNPIHSTTRPQKDSLCFLKHPLESAYECGVDLRI